MKSTAAAPKSKKRSRIIIGLIVAAIAVVGLSASGFAFAATQESHDQFCASCHTQPESTFVARSTSTSVDLASHHTTQNALCIDCHSGQGIAGRMSAELMGAKNAFKWFTGTAVQPAVVNTPIGDPSCLKCHQDVTQRGFTPKEQIAVPGGRSGEGDEEGRTGHWHQLLTRWQTADPNAGTCVTCHSGHATDGNAQNGFMNDPKVEATCDACHRSIRRED
jgi:nitrate/TMAO reductase-like tetraheme cytochrome c subunit